MTSTWSVTNLPTTLLVAQGPGSVSLWEKTSWGLTALTLNLKGKIGFRQSWTCYFSYREWGRIMIPYPAYTFESLGGFLKMILMHQESLIKSGSLGGGIWASIFSEMFPPDQNDSKREPMLGIAGVECINKGSLNIDNNGVWCYKGRLETVNGHGYSHWGLLKGSHAMGHQ